MKKRLIGLILAVLLIVVFSVIAPFEGLDHAGMISIGIFLGAIVCFVTNVFPMAITCLVLMVITPWFGIGSLTQVWADFGGTSFFFVMFTFGLMAAMSVTTLPQRVAAGLTKISKGKGKPLVFGFMIVAAVLSGFMSNFGTLLMFCTLITAFLTATGRKPGESGIGRSLMLGLPLTCCAGGLIAPSGTPGNLIAQSFFDTLLGETVSFGSWFISYFPLVIVAVLIISVLMCIFFKPENLPQDKMQSVIDDVKALGPMTWKEKAIIIIYVLTIVCWFLSTWFPFLNTTVVAAIALGIMFLPGLDLVTWKDVARESDWNLLFVVGAVAVTMGCVNTTGAMDWIVDKAFANVANWSTFMIFFIFNIVIMILRTCIPTAPSTPAIFTPILISVAGVAGVSPIALGMIPVIWASFPMLLIYTEPIYLYTFAYGYYKPFDLDKFGPALSIVMCIVLSFLLPVMF